MSPPVAMQTFESPPPPAGVVLEIDHTLQWGRDEGEESCSYRYDFLDYVFTSQAGAVRGRWYRDEPERVCLTGDVQPSPLMQAVVRYFSDREFTRIERLGRGGYEPVDMHALAGEGRSR